MTPLAGIKVLELAGLAPAPFAGLILADYGADVVRIDRPSAADSASMGITPDSLTRGKRSIALNLKDKNDKETFLDLVKQADVLIEGYRPDVMEQLGLSPSTLAAINPRLIFARLTGFQRSGTWAKAAGHDINYLALSGSLAALGTRETPVAPGNVLGDFAGGGMTCVLGILLALHERQRTGKGGVVEANMVDGVSYLSTFIRHAQMVKEMWGYPRGENLLDGGCPYYQCYRTADVKFVAVGCLEPQFYAAFTERFGVALPDRSRENWPEMKDIMTRRFAELTLAQWCAIYDGTDACVTPVMEKILHTRVPVHVNSYPGLPESITHHKGREKIGMKAGQHQDEVLKHWSKL